MTASSADPAWLAGVLALGRDAQAAWPELPFDAAAFAAYVRARVPEGAPLEAVRGGDLLLASACATRLPKALELFEARYMPVVASAVQRLKLDVGTVDDLQQSLREQLFLGDAPKILEYAGTGDLTSWLRVVATRAALKLKRGRTPVSEDDALLDVASASGNPELLYLKGTAREAFRASFRQALASLEPREQTLLRQHYIDGLSIDELGVLYGAHRTSTSRWLRETRQQLLRATRKALQHRLRGSKSECESIMRAARSQFEMTFRDLLLG